MQIIKKAWYVYHEGMLGFGPEIYNEINEIPAVHAETAGKAKMLACDWTYYDLPNGDQATFLDLKVKRAKGKDKVLDADGKIEERWRVESRLKRQEEVDKRKEAVEKHPDDAKFYIQNGYVGNAMIFWGHNHNGYTCNLDKAGLYSKEEVLKHFVNGRAQDIIWLQSHIDQHIMRTVDAQYTDRKYAC